MGRWVADSIHAARGGHVGSVLVLGLTFKEDVPDLRNSRVVEVIRRLEELGHTVSVHDPLADREEARRDYGIELDPEALRHRYDLVVASVGHRRYRAMPADEIRGLVADGGCVADIGGIWRGRDLAGVERWTL